MRPSSGNSSDGGRSSNSGNLLKANEGSSLNLPSSRSSSFRSSQEGGATGIERTNSWRSSNLSSPSPYTSEKSKPFVNVEENKSSTLPWSYSSSGSRGYQPLGFTNPFTSTRERDRDTNSELRASASAEEKRRSTSLQPLIPAHGGSVSPRPPSYAGSEDDNNNNLPISRTPSNASSVSWNPTSTSSNTLPTRRKLQKVELLHLTEPCRELVNPGDVVVCPGEEVFLAQPIITPIERLRRKDREVARALEEKQKLIEEILNIPHEELESIAENPGCLSSPGPKSAAEILLSALSQAKSLTALVNKTLKISEEEAVRAMALRRRGDKTSLADREKASFVSDQQRIVAKGEKLIEITSAINKQLTMLLAIIQENEKERESLRRELSRSQDQVRCLISGETSWSSPLSPASISSPLSPITPASISPMPSPFTSKSSSPPLSLSDGPGDRQSVLSSLSR
eukprot:TRINITY_DN10965_c0_g1_i1.p1 TRINITY_DN10965_c0_g1~~TRINITY_DN10965_c0_g1_i1.p1  ORF type:complete len:480 (-),score=69.09 TRINITY_DN10965_c0_g1_i1:100-1464(-)